MKLNNIIRTCIQFFKKFFKETIIAIVLAIIAALGFEFCKDIYHKQIIENNSKAVATILTYDKGNKNIAIGSGVFISSDGELVTNYHVIANRFNIRAKMTTGAYYDIKRIIGINKALDLAILQFEAKDVNFIKIKNKYKYKDIEDLKNGDEIFTLGSPFGLEKSYSAGTISNPRRKDGTIELIQFSASISSGNSGGGLFNRWGNLIGITSSSILPTSKDEIAQNLNFAIPVKYIEKVKGPGNQYSKDSSDIYFAEGVIKYNKKEYNEAIKNFVKTISIDEKYVAAYIQLGGIYYDTQNFEKEISILEKALRLSPNNPEINFAIGMAYEDIGEFDLSITSYERVLKLRPKDQDALFEMCLLNIITGNKEKALKQIPNLRKLNSGIAKEIEILIYKSK
jgi:tetratricopeptide (TPR) repeat protein